MGFMIRWDINTKQLCVFFCFAAIFCFLNGDLISNVALPRLNIWLWGHHRHASHSCVFEYWSLAWLQLPLSLHCLPFYQIYPLGTWRGESLAWCSRSKGVLCLDMIFINQSVHQMNKYNSPSLYVITLYLGVAAFILQQPFGKDFEILTYIWILQFDSLASKINCRVIPSTLNWSFPEL